MAVDLYGSGEGLDLTKPVTGVDLYAPDPNASGPFKRGLRTGIADLKSIGGGIVQAAGRGFGAKPIEDYGAAVVKAAQEASAPDRMQVEDVGKAFEQGVLPGIGASVDLVKYAIGNQLPMLATMAATGGAGAVAGRAIAGKAAIEAAKRAGVSTATDIGAEIGVGAGAVGLEYGQIAPEALASGVENPLTRTAIGAVGAGALDTILPVLAARRLGLIGPAGSILKPRKAGFGAIAKEAGGTAAAVGAFETATEAAQTVIERAAAGQSMTDPEAMSDYLNSAVIGGIMGVVTGGVVGGIHAKGRPVEGAAPAVVPPVQETPPPTPEEQQAALVSQHAAAVQQMSDTVAQVEQTKVAHEAAAVRLKELEKEAKLPFTDRRPKSEIVVEQRALQAQRKQTKPTLDKLETQYHEAKRLSESLAPQIMPVQETPPFTEREQPPMVNAPVEETPIISGAIPATAQVVKPASEIPATPEVPKVQDLSATTAGTEQAGLEPWQRTQKDYVAAIESGIRGLPDHGGLSEKQAVRMHSLAAVTNHRFSVERAIAEGKPVPAQVLAEYPDLVKTPPTIAEQTQQAVAGVKAGLGELAKEPAKAPVVPSRREAAKRVAKVSREAPAGSQITVESAMAQMAPDIKALAESQVTSKGAQRKRAVNLTKSVQEIIEKALAIPPGPEREHFVGNARNVAILSPLFADKGDLRTFIGELGKAAGKGTLYSRGAGEIAPKLEVDNPGGEWLKQEQQYAESRGRGQFGEPKSFGPVTGIYDKSALVPVDVLANLPGLNGEQGRVRTEDLAKLKAHMKERGRLPASGREGIRDYAPYIEVNHQGEAWVSEGNHRIMAAKALGWKYLPIEIKYFAGGERADSVLSPAKIEEYAKQAAEDGRSRDEYKSNAALTTEQFHRLPEDAKKAAVDTWDGIMTQRGQELLGHMRQLVGEPANLTVTPFTAAPGEPAGRYTPVGRFKALISLAVNAKNPPSVADHEAMHYIMEHRLDARERGVVNRALQPGRPLFEKLVEKARRYDRENQTHLADEIQANVENEAPAYAFEFWRRGEIQVEGLLSTIFAKIRNFLEKIVNFVEGQGFVSIEDIFAAIDRGQYAERQSVYGQFSENAGDFQSAGLYVVGNRAWNVVTKPDSIGALHKNFFGSKLAIKPYLSAMQSMMLPVLKHDQIKRAVIESIAVNVVDIFAEYGFTPEQFVGNPAMVMEGLPPSSRGTVIDGFGKALEQTRARIGTAIATALATGRNIEVLPALRAGDLNAREVVRVLSPRNILGEGSVLGGAGFSANNRRVDGASSATETTESALDAARKGDELSAAQLAALLNLGSWSHEDKTGHLYDKFRAPENITPEMVARAAAGLPLFSKAGLDDTMRGLTQEQKTLYSRAAATATEDMKRQMQAGELTRVQLNQMGTKLMDNAQLPNEMFKVTMGALKAEFGGSIGGWWLKNIATPNYIGRFSDGYKNVMQTLNTYIRYRKLLVEGLLREKIPEWYQASTIDRDTAFKALLDRTVRGLSRNSAELSALMGRLTESQRGMFVSATKMVEGFLNAEFESDKVAYKQMLTTPGTYEKWLKTRQDQVADMIDKGYVPLRRYGSHRVDVFYSYVDSKGRQVKQLAARVFTEREATAVGIAASYNDEIKRSGVKLTVERGTRHETSRDTTISIQQFLDTARRNGVAISIEERERLVQALTAADSMVRNRLMRRENVPGYSEDGMRVLNEFGVAMSGKIAYAKFASAIDAAADGRPVTSDVVKGEAQIAVDDGRNLWAEQGPMSGFYRNLSDELSDYVLVPDHTGTWSRKLRGAAMMYFIGGSISGAMVNTMSVPMLTVPELSIHTNYWNAFSTTMAAWKTAWQYQAILRDVSRLKDAAANPMPEIDKVPGLREAIIAAADHVMDTEIHQIMGLAQGTIYSQSRGVQRAVEAWMSPFRISEQMNRATSFIAAYRIGVENRLTGQELLNFAGGIVDSTQNNYNEANRPGAARNPIFAIMFMFKSFPLFMTEAIALMYKASPKSAVFMLLGLVAMTGIQGLPFAETLEDLIDTISQRLFNSPFNTRRAMRNVLKSASEAITGYDMSDLVLRGAINDVLGMSASSRIGAGDFVPGSRLGTADADYGRTLEAMLGAPIAMLTDVAKNAGRFVGGVTKGDWSQMVDATRAGGPVAIRNLIKGTEQFNNGYASDARGQKLVDVTGPESLFQMAGVAPASLARAYELDRIDKQTKAFYTQVRGDMEHQLVRALKSGDAAKAAEVWDTAKVWDESNPEMPMRLSGAAVRRQIVLSGLHLNERTLRLLPRQLRGTSVAAEGLSLRE